jgi:gliding motility-associated-like protein
VLPIPTLGLFAAYPLHYSFVAYHFNMNLYIGNQWARLFQQSAVLFVLLSWLALHPAYASHNVAGQITCRLVGPNTYEILLTTYTDPAPRGVDRCAVDLEVWACNGILLDKLTNIPRSNGNFGGCSGGARMGEVVKGTIKRNFYSVTYRFNGAGCFFIRFFDVARIARVRNMNNPDNTAFFVETTLNIAPLIGDNNTPELLNEPLDDACIDVVWTHNPGGFDRDGDSLVYSLIPSMQYDPPNVSRPINVSNFSSPASFGGSPDSMFIDRRTGLITWQTPKQAGVYNIAILVEEYRNGQKIGQVIRDMAIFVDPCPNRPPIISAIRDTCTRPNSTLVFDVKCWDPDWRRREDEVLFRLNNNGQNLNNGPFQAQPDSAYLVPRLPFRWPEPRRFPILETGNLFQANPPIADTIELQFIWRIDCDNIRRSFYQADFFARNTANNAKWYSDNHVTTIRIVPQSVGEIVAKPSRTRSIGVRWAKHECANVLAYEIYRSDAPDDSKLIDEGCCLDRVPLESNYELIHYQDADATLDSLYFEDTDSGRGLQFRSEYCYRVVAIFRDSVRSCPSPPACSQISKDVPILTNNDVDLTSVTEGRIISRWTMPDTRLITPEFYPPPYTYEVWRSLDNQSYEKVSPNLPLDETSFIDNNINTEELPYYYAVRFVDGQLREIGSTHLTSNTFYPASSIFLTITPAHKALKLNWEELTPWRNRTYTIYRRGPNETEFTQIHIKSGRPVANKQMARHVYIDKNLQLGQSYCYYISSDGGYVSVPELDSLVNRSNIRCAIPVDTLPPCLPGLDSIFTQVDCDNFTLEYSFLQADSNCSGDLKYYSIYKSRDPGGPYTQLIGRIEQGLAQRLLRFSYTNVDSIAGCYVLQATDTTEQANISKFSHEKCVDHCPVFIMPNVFTPNADGANDFLQVQFLRSISRFDFNIYDRWGKLMGTSSDPLRLWNGNDTDNSPAQEGQYFYILDLEMNNLRRTKLTRSGSITLLR